LLGDGLKETILFVAICLGILSLIACPAALAAAQGKELTSYEGNLSEKELAPFSTTDIFGPAGLAVAETVKFKAPSAGWALKNASILAWDGFNGTAASVPRMGLIALEIRDKDLNLLYRFTDMQYPYTNFILNITHVLFMNIDLPSVPVSDEFYVCFYDRGAVVATFEYNNLSQNSYFFDGTSKKIFAASVPEGENETAPINWIMKVYGE
jgi:hypothetical protein